MGFLSDVGDFFGGSAAQKYDPNSDQAKAARTLGGPQHTYDVSATQAAGARSGPTDMTNVAGSRVQQQGLLGDLGSAASGNGPSAAVQAGNAQRDANLAQAAALQGGRRGQGAGVGIRVAGNQVVAGNQQASQAQAAGQANEMATARGQQVGLLGQVAGNDLNAANMAQQNSQFNANLGQGNSQFNAGLAQNAALQNQQAQLGISNAELQQRARQEGLSYSNLQPGSPGLIQGAMSAISDPSAKEDRHRVDGTYGRALSPVDAKTDIRPATMGLPQLGGGQGPDPFAAHPGTIGPNSREAPNWYVTSPSSFGDVLGRVGMSVLMSKGLESLGKGKSDAASGADGSAGASSSGFLGGLMGLLGGGGGGAAAGGAALSDPRSKEDVRPVSKVAAREMFEEAPAYSYFYKPDARDVGAPEGRQVSVMWDDLQRTPAGRRMDGGREPETGYHTVDYLKGLPAAFASLSDLNDRMSRLEGGNGKGRR
jgi:hypothetical protein